MAQTQSIGFGRKGSLDLGITRLPTGIVHNDSLGSDVLALIGSASTITSNATFSGNAKGNTNNTYFAWDAGSARFGLIKTAGFDGALGYAGNVITAGDPLPTLDIVQMLGQSTIDPLGGGTRTLRGQWDNNGDFRTFASAFISGSATVSVNLSVTGALTVGSTATFSNTLTANGGITTPTLAVSSTATVGGSNIIKISDAATSAPPAIAASGSLGAVNSRFAREDHTHAALAAAGNYVSSLAVVNNASVNASTGAVTITNSLTPTFTTVTATGAISAAGLSSSTTLGVTGVSTLAGMTATTATFSGATQVNNTLGVTGVATLAGMTATTATFSGATQINNTLGVTGTATLAGVTATTATFSGATQVNSTLGVTGTASLAGLTASTATFSGATQVNSTLGVTGTSTLAAVLGTTGSFSSTMLISGVLSTRANVSMQTSAGTPVFIFDPAAGSLTAPSQSINGSALVDSSVAYQKLSGTAQAVIQAFPSSDSQFSMLRWVTSTGSFLDPNTGLQRDGLTINNGATRVADGSAYAGYSIANTGMTTNVLAASGPAYAGLAPGQYQAIYYLKVNSTVSTSPAVTLQVTGTAVANNPAVTAAPSELGTTYVGITVPFTITATTNTVNTTITSNQLPGAVTWQFSHVRIQQFDGKTVASSVQYFFADASIKNAQIFDLTVSKLTAGSITTDDIQIGAGGRLYIGASKTATTRLEWTSAGLVSYTPAGQTFNLSSTGALSLTGAITGASSIMIGTTGFGVDTTGNMWLGATTYAGATTFSVSAAGSLLAASGSIAGWTLSSTTLTGTNIVLDKTGTITVGTGSSVVAMQQGVGMWAGNAAFASAPFSVNTAGFLTATSGKIGGWTVNSTNIISSSLRLKIDNGGSFIAAYDSTLTKYVALRGASSDTKMLQVFDGTVDTFVVTTAGAVTMTNAAITGSTTISGTLTVAGATTLNNTLSLGTGTISSTNFNVTSAGVVTATSATLNSVTVAGSSNLNGTLTLGGTLSMGSGNGTTVIQNNANLWFGAAKPKGVIQSAASVSSTPSTTGGSVPIGTYIYAIVPSNALGMAGTPAYSSATSTTTATSSVAITWINSAVPDPNSEYEAATQIKVYRQLQGLTNALWYLVSGALAATATSFTDTTGATGTGTSLTNIPNTSRAALYFDGNLTQTLTLGKSVSMMADLTMANGAVFRTGPVTGDRIEIANGNRDSLTFYSGDPNETVAASIGYSAASTGTTRALLSFTNGSFSSGITGTTSMALENNTSRGWIKMNASTSVIVTSPAITLNGNSVTSAVTGGTLIQSGTYTITFVSGVATATVNFGTAFTTGSTPVVILTAGAITGNTSVTINLTGATASGFTYRAQQQATGTTYNGTITGQYIAVGV